ncbi:MAG: hypothetical protein M3410_08165 [Acidobacteriota bacterium]|nr:hypothetical protein [Acidobacteriota bacterium]
MPYHIEWAEPAEVTYQQISQRAQACLEAGQEQHPAVLVLNEVDNVIDTTLKTNPCDPRFALAGILSVIYKIPLRSVFISYIIYPSEPTVLIMTICRKQPGTRKLLNNKIDDGSVDRLLASLGIERPLIRVDLNDGLLH